MVVDMQIRNQKAPCFRAFLAADFYCLTKLSFSRMIPLFGEKGRNGPASPKMECAQRANDKTPLSAFFHGRASWGTLWFAGVTSLGLAACDRSATNQQVGFRAPFSARGVTMPKRGLNISKFWKFTYYFTGNSYFWCPDTGRIFDTQYRLVCNPRIVEDMRKTCASNAVLSRAICVI